MEERTMKLYGFPPSPNTWKVRALAAHLNLPLGLEIVDLTKPRTPEYLAINPTGRTPTLVDGDYTLREENGINQYLGSRKSKRKQPCGQSANWHSRNRRDMLRSADQQP